MSLSREISQFDRRNVIKTGSPANKLRIVDFRNALEEIVADRQDDVRVDLGEIVGGPESGEGSGAGPGARDETKSAVTEAYEQGFEAGKMQAARALAEEYGKKIGQVSEDFESIAKQFTAEAERYNQDFDKAVVSLALAIAKRIVAREIEIDEGSVLARTREAIRKIIGVEKIKIHVNPADEEYIREHRNELSAYADSVKEIVVEADNKVERGGCVIESELGNIDARISTQFDLIEEALLGLTR